MIVIRHGHTEWNATGRYMGHLDAPLTARGLQQAERLARRLARRDADTPTPKFDAPFSLTPESAQPLAKPKKASREPAARKPADWKEIGKNSDGHPVYENAQGVRSCAAI